MPASSPTFGFGCAVLRAARWFLGVVALTAGGLSLRSEPAVATLYGGAWSPGDTTREGAAELEVLLCAAQLRHANPLAGIVGVSPGRGAFSPAAEIALTRVAHMGLPVVRVAQRNPLPAHEGDVFIEAGSLSPTEAQRLLVECLSRYGAPPAAADPARPSRKETAAIQAKLALYQVRFNAHNLTQVAMR
jgi:L-asparaginase